MQAIESAVLGAETESTRKRGARVISVVRPKSGLPAQSIASNGEESAERMMLPTGCLPTPSIPVARKRKARAARPLATEPVMPAPTNTASDGGAAANGKLESVPPMPLQQSRRKAGGVGRVRFGTLLLDADSNLSPRKRRVRAESKLAPTVGLPAQPIAGHIRFDAQTSPAGAPTPSPESATNSDGLHGNAPRTGFAIAPAEMPATNIGATSVDGERLIAVDTHVCNALSAHPAVAPLIAAGRYRRKLAKGQQRIFNAVFGMCMEMTLDTNGDVDKAAAAKLSAKVMTAYQSGDDKGDAAVMDVLIVAAPFWVGRAPLVEAQARIEKRMREDARLLPVWPWVESVRGFGPLSFAKIIAETGDLNNYATVSKVWKRLGQAVTDGKTDRRGARGATAFNIRDPLIKAQGKSENGNAGPYRLVYESAKAKKLAALAAGECTWSLKHIDVHAQRVMVKELLKNLWIEWRRATRA